VWPTGCSALHSRARRVAEIEAELLVVPMTGHIWPAVPSRAHAPVCHHGARHHGQANGVPACSRTHGRAWTSPLAGPMLTTVHASSPRASEDKSRPSACCGVCVTLVKHRCLTLPMPPSCTSARWTRVRVEPSNPRPGHVGQLDLEQHPA
jgi:hypothetical protein